MVNLDGKLCSKQISVRGLSLNNRADPAASSSQPFGGREVTDDKAKVNLSFLNIETESHIFHI